MAIHYQKDNEQIVTLTFDHPNHSTNLIDALFGQALAESVNQLAQETELTGVILASAKNSFIAGADISGLYAMTDPQDAFQQVEDFKAVLRQLETLGKPVVAALNGTALGGGFEVALACHHRVAVNNGRSKFGFPEVTLGLLPAGGGVTRLVRMTGLQAAFPYLTEGTQLPPRQALDAGLISALADDEADMLAQARAWILANPNAKQPWDTARFRIPGGDPRRPQVAQMLAIAPAMLKKKTRGNYPAPQAIMNTMAEGALVDFATASRIESRYFAQLATGQVAKNMISTFWFQLNEIKKGKSRPQLPAQPTQKVGVLGAGMMGHGIAYVSAYAGMDVVLKDVTLEQAQTGKEKIATLLQKRVSRGKLTPEKQQVILDRIHPTAETQDLTECDLIIEAVFEDRTLKANVTEETEAVIGETAVFASNTSTLPITGLARAFKRPSQFIGLHFFSPVHKMKLVEIIVGEETNEATLAKAFDYVLAINKTPIVVNDSRGFYTSRVFGTYVNEGLALLSEGQHPRAIESAGLQAGMPVGPLAVSDEVSLSLMAHVRQQTSQDLAQAGQEMPHHPAHDVLDVMLAEGRLGKAKGAGFYEYPSDQPKHLWSGLWEKFGVNGKQLPQQEMIDRLLFIQALETVRCLQEGVLNSTADANLGSIFGWGFAPFQGGTLQYINGYGLPAFVARSQALAQTYGDRFTPPTLLVEMAEQDKQFH